MLRNIHLSCIKNDEATKFLTAEFEFEYCEECHGDQLDHMALWDSEEYHNVIVCDPHCHWLVFCSAEKDWERGNRWGHPCRIDDCINHERGTGE